MNPSNPESTPPRRRAAPWLRRLGLLLLAGLVTVALFRLVRDFDWHSVAAALGLLQWWHPLLLGALVLVRQVFNALPLSYYIAGVSWWKATINDLAATTMSAFIPPPSDMVFRVSMFTSWGVKPAAAVAGTVMNALTFFIVRFAAPLPGFVLLIFLDLPYGFRWLDLLSLAIAAALILGIVLLVRADTWASWLGHHAALLARKVKPSVEPAQWAGACVDFRTHITSRFATAFPKSLVSTAAMLVVDYTVLLLALRFLGVDPVEAPMLVVMVAFLFAFPLTAFPMTGLGLVDVLVLAALVQFGGSGIQEAVLAALVIWRVFTLAGPLLLGLCATVVWRHSLKVEGRRKENLES